VGGEENYALWSMQFPRLRLLALEMFGQLATDLAHPNLHLTGSINGKVAGMF
jgi:hypothetical protein